MMRWISSVSLLWKILLSTSIALTLLFAVVSWIVQDQFVRAASANLDEEVRESFQAYDSLWRARAEQLATVSLVLSRMPDVRAAFSTGDQATIRDTAGEIWEKISRRSALFLVTDARGAVLASLGARTGGEKRDFPAVRAAADQFPKQAAGFLTHGDRMYQIVITPVYVAAGRGTALLNVLVAGFEIGPELVRELKESTGGSDFVFLAGGKVIASTLAPGALAAIGAGGRKGPSSGEYAQFATTLQDVTGHPVGELRILRSFDAARRRMAALRTNLVVVWAAAVLAGLAITYLLARRIVEPVRDLDRAASEIGKGNYDVQLKVGSRDEIGRLAETFNKMCSNIRGARGELIRQERIATIGRLSTSIIHDLRNPLAAIYGGSEMLVDDELSPHQVKRLAANIYRSSRRVQELLQELADVTRGRAHATELCRLREVVLAACESVAPQAHRHRVEINIDVPANLELPLDRSPMERVFENLLANAVEAMPDGGSIQVRAERTDGAVTVTVEDSGPGIPDSIAARLFEPFVTAGKKNGMGLGLALSRQTVLDHGGDLWVDAGCRSGARFRLRFAA
jgi:signal transduction histidine kinase